MRKQIIAGNWKMNLSLNEAFSLASEIKWMVKDEVNNATEIILIPPYIYLAGIQNLLSDSNIKIGAQNCHHKTYGAFTGEISAKMLVDIGVNYVVIGHSERRQYHGETNQLLSDKINAAIENGLTPIYCFGETLNERQEGRELLINAAQIKEGLFHLSPDLIKKVVLAYEPVWAIGTGQTASSSQAQNMHHFVRQEIANKYGENISNMIEILYGGSMKPDNAKELLSCPDIDGGLIGGASLESRSFVEIIKCCNR
jgi:triosephosphate isomerase